MKVVFIMSDMSQAHAAQVMNSQWIYTFWPGGEAEPWLIDLNRDPLQLRNVAARNPDICRKLHEPLAAFDAVSFKDVASPWRAARARPRAKECVT